MMSNTAVLMNIIKQIPDIYHDEVTSYLNSILVRHEQQSKEEPLSVSETKEEAKQQMMANEKQEEYIRLPSTKTNFPANIKGVNSDITLEELMKKHQYKRTMTFEDFQKEAAKIEWKESLEELLAAIK